MLLCWNGPYAVRDIIGHLPAVIRLAFPRNLDCGNVNGDGRCLIGKIDRRDEHVDLREWTLERDGRAGQVNASSDGARLIGAEEGVAGLVVGVARGRCGNGRTRTAKSGIAVTRSILMQ